MCIRDRAYSDLLDRLIELALERHAERAELETTIDPTALSPVSYTHLTLPTSDLV